MKVYKLKNNLKYKVPKDKAQKGSYLFRMYISKRKFQKTYGRSYKSYNRYKRPSVLWLVLFYYGFIIVQFVVSNTSISVT